MSCIHSASCRGHYHIVESLLNDGADVNLQDEDNETPLHFAARHGHINIVKLLIENGADYRLKNSDGMSPALWAMTESNVDVVIYLLQVAIDEGSDLQSFVNACDKVWQRLSQFPYNATIVLHARSCFWKILLIGVYILPGWRYAADGGR